MVEETTVTGKKAASTTVSSGSKPEKLSEVDGQSESRILLGNNELDRLLGGGLVEGSLVLIGGEPGIGKSTLSLQIPLQAPDIKTLYVTGEESVRQVKLRAKRLGGDDSHCYIYSETLMENILREAREMAPDLMIVDSVQTMYSQGVESSAGSVTQIKETASLLFVSPKRPVSPSFSSGISPKRAASPDRKFWSTS